MKLQSLFIGLACALTAMSVCAQNQLTLIGNSPLDVSAQGLTLNKFAADEKLEGARLAQACESIDNSMIVILADQLPPATLEEWFSKPGVCNSLTELLRRGGVLYFGWNSWSNLNSPLPSTRAFYKSCQIPFPTGSNLGENPKDAGKFSYANAECDAPFLRAPNNYVESDGKGEFAIVGIRYFKNWNDPALETYFATKEGEPVLVGVRNVLGKGTAIYSTTFTPMRAKAPFFFINLIHYAYGK